MALGPSNQSATPFPVAVGNAQKTAFTIAAFGPSVIVANAPPGLYRCTVCVVITTSQGSDTVTVNFICTDDQQAETVAVLSAVSTAAQGQFNGSQTLENTATANLSWSITTNATTAVANFYLVVERIF